MDAFEKAFLGQNPCHQKKYQVSHHLFLRQIGNSDYVAGHPYTDEVLEPGGWNGELVAGFIGANAIETLLEKHCCGENMTTDEGFSQCWCNYYAALGEPVNITISPGSLSKDPGQTRSLVVIQGNPDGKAWEVPQQKGLPVSSLVPATYENNLALMNQTFPILFGPGFDYGHFCPQGVSADVIEELRAYTQGCFLYEGGFPQLYEKHKDEFREIGFFYDDSPLSTLSSLEDTYEMQWRCASDRFGFKNYTAVKKDWYVNANEFLKRVKHRSSQAPTPGKGKAEFPLCESTPWVRAYLYWAFGETSLFLGDGMTPGSPEYIMVPVGKRGPIKLDEMPKQGVLKRSVRDLLNLRGTEPGPTAKCLIEYKRRTFGWHINYRQ